MFVKTSLEPKNDLKNETIIKIKKKKIMVKGVVRFCQKTRGLGKN